MSDAFLPPPPPAAMVVARPPAVRTSEALLVGAGLLLVVIAGLLAFLPVPPNAFGSCGPDYGSSPAVSVYLDPDRVLDWQPPRSRAHLALRNECLIDARYRVRMALGLLPGGVLLAGCALATEVVWRRSATPPVPAFPVYPR